MQSKAPQHAEPASVYGIISRKPGIVVRMTVLFYMSIIVSLVAAAWFIRYPEIVKISVTVSDVQKDSMVVNLFVSPYEEARLSEGQRMQFRIDTPPGEPARTIHGQIATMQRVDDTGHFTAHVATDESKAKMYLKNDVRGEGFVYISNMRVLQRVMYKLSHR